MAVDGRERQFPQNWLKFFEQIFVVCSAGGWGGGWEMRIAETSEDWAISVFLHNHLQTDLPWLEVARGKRNWLTSCNPRIWLDSCHVDYWGPGIKIIWQRCALYGKLPTPSHSFPSHPSQNDSGMTKKSFLGHPRWTEAGMEGFPSLSFQHQFSHSNVILI